MEANPRWVLVTAIAPVAWGSTYYVTHAFLPAGHPLWGALIRALPAGLLLLAVCRRLPRGVWWWRSLVLGTLNVGAFFVLVYVAAQQLPSSVASTVMATSPVVMMLFAWLLLGDPPPVRHLAGAGLGIAGVALMLLAGTGTVDLGGVLASAGAMVMSSFGYLLAERWGRERGGDGGGDGGGVGVLASTSWQLVAGGLVLVPFAVLVEGAPPALDAPAVAAFAYVAVIATALAFVAWFAGLRHLQTGTVGLVGLLNPVTGVLLGTAIAAEALTGRQLSGLALVLAGVLLGRSAPRSSERRRGLPWRRGTASRFREHGEPPERADRSDTGGERRGDSPVGAARDLRRTGHVGPGDARRTGEPGPPRLTDRRRRRPEPPLPGPRRG
ncbi:EamA family transporter [Actinophytocola xinjiangensis]|uniref:EamA family transporter n=1 Tax=Actinophytocola xinjiangensis TaxID=485602 RepID=A0A7Z0WQ95_9PSEU|nr:EamA family transporter [Actinophytocola xinjiangensis]OLF12298.1 EamA family transporter [Actinophytocola xinjiangensis]